MKWWLRFQCATLKLTGISLILLTDFNRLGWIIFFSGGAVVLAHIFMPRLQGLCDVVTGFETKDKEVWLTIDDGPDPVDTPQILKLLEQYNAKATFFMIGESAARYPMEVDAVLAQGHSVGSHTQTHPLKFYWIAGPRWVACELDASLSALERSEAPVELYRSPVGFKNFFLRSALKLRSLHCVAWSIRSGDGLGKDVETIVRRVEANLSPGAIILMHEGARLDPGVRVNAIAAVLKMLSESGYRCVLPAASQFHY